MPSTLRWLLWPTVFVPLGWSLLLSPAPVLQLTPALWKTATANASLALKLPRSRAQAFELGWHASLYAACVHSLPAENCTVHIEAATAASGAAAPLTPSQLTQSTLRAGLVLEDEERSVAQRILGLFSFVNLVWLVSIFGALATLVPFVLYVFGEKIAQLLKTLYTELLVPYAPEELEPQPNPSHPPAASLKVQRERVS